MKTMTRVLLITVLMNGGFGLTQAAPAEGHGHHGKRSDGMDWKAGLNEEQSRQLATLKLEYKKQIFPLKLKLKEAKYELAVMIATDKPNQRDIDKKIDAIIKLKAEKMRLKVAHKIAVRKLLNNEQQVLFDLKLLKKGFHGKDGGHQGRH
ncbi:MAG: periplasmic heavy metal sensor [Gammaproteobacteria bacterium]|nr:periplasmic heavy metal sensor [Gammaproteobacteria bacterium]